MSLQELINTASEQRNLYVHCQIPFARVALAKKEYADDIEELDFED